MLVPVLLLQPLLLFVQSLIIPDVRGIFLLVGWFYWARQDGQPHGEPPAGCRHQRCGI
jgi:hypothetical protein